MLELKCRLDIRGDSAEGTAFFVPNRVEASFDTKVPKPPVGFNNRSTSAGHWDPLS